MSQWRSSASATKRIPPGEPPAPEALGNAGWTILHTSAAAFPNRPSPDQQQAMKQFIESWSKIYACSHCAYHMRTVLASQPPVVTSKRAVSQYVCELHNNVNEMLGKEVFDCDPDVVLKRWHPTYPNMEDVPTIEEQIAEDQKRRGEAPAAAPSSSPRVSDSGPSSGWGWRRSNTNSPTDKPPVSGSTNGKVPDSETDVEAVLARLKGCQVYCPEKH